MLDSPTPGRGSLEGHLDVEQADARLAAGHRPAELHGVELEVLTAGAEGPGAAGRSGEVHVARLAMAQRPLVDDVADERTVVRCGQAWRQSRGPG